MTKQNIYKVTLGSGFEQWDRYDLFLTVVGFDAAGEVACYCSQTGKADNGTITVTSEPCHHIEIYAYVIAADFPETVVIRDAPPFPTRLQIWRDGAVIEDSLHDTNQWGGLTISGKIVGKE